MRGATTLVSAVFLALALACAGVAAGVSVVGGADTGGGHSVESGATGPLSVGGTDVAPGHEAETDRMPVPVAFAFERGAAEDVLRAELVVEDTSGLESVSVRPSPGMTVESTDGFAADGDEYVWDGGTERPTLTYRHDLSEAIVGTHWDEESLVTIADTPGVIARDAGDAVYAEVVENRSVSGQGTIAEHVVVLGNYTEHERTVGDQRIRLVVPGSTDLDGTPAGMLDPLANASEDLSVGADEPVVHAVVTPDTTGYGTDETFYVAEDAATSEVLQYYVRSQTEFSVREDGRDLFTALPGYYGTQLAVQNGYEDREDFETMLGAGHERPAAAWTDRQIRLATDGERTLQDVFRRLNDQSGVALEDYRSAVAAVGNESIADTAVAQLREEESPPDAWSDGAYERAYGFEPASTGTAVTDLRARGSGWNRTLATDAFAVSVGLNETVSVRTAANNSGGIPGHVSVRHALTAPDETVLVDRTERTWVDPGADWTSEETYAFENTGEYRLAAADERWTVQVVPMDDTVTVTSLDVPENVTANTTIDVTARVNNTDETLSRTDVTATVNGSEAAAERVVLGPGENRTLAMPVHVDEAGPRRISVGERATTIDVEGTGLGIGALGPGFGPVVALLSVVVAALLGRRRYGGGA